MNKIVKILCLCFIYSCHGNETKIPVALEVQEYIDFQNDPSVSLRLYSNGIYSYKWSSCVVSGIDSGKFQIIDSIIHFASFLEKKVDTTNKRHGQITPLTNQNSIIRNNRIYYVYQNGIIDPKSYMIKRGYEVPLRELLDSNGNGYVEHLNQNFKIKERGLYKSFKMFNGEITNYDSEDKIVSIEFISQGYLRTKYIIENNSDSIYINDYNNLGKTVRLKIKYQNKIISDSIL